MIVLNGEPFLRYNLRALYPFAHQIVVVEGAVASAAPLATSDGHSTDGTLETLRRFQREEDPEGKLEIVTRNGLWEEKGEQSRAFARRATGDYLWIAAADEFYHARDMSTVVSMLENDPSISAVFFKQITFWGGFDYIADGWYLRQRQHEGPGIVLRLTRWGEGYRYASHRPVSITDQAGRDVTSGRVVDGRTLAATGVFMYHYSLVFPRQVREKASYYSKAGWADTPEMEAWAENTFTRLHRPYRVHNAYKYPSWLERFDGQHPEQIRALKADLASGLVHETQRDSKDIESLLDSRWYAAGRAVLKGTDPLARLAVRLRRRARASLVRSGGASARKNRSSRSRKT
jgi:hypothetical protein